MNIFFIRLEKQMPYEKSIMQISQVTYLLPDVMALILTFYFRLETITLHMIHKTMTSTAKFYRFHTFWFQKKIICDDPRHT